MIRCNCGAEIEPHTTRDGKTIVLEPTEVARYNTWAVRDGSAEPFDPEIHLGGTEFVEHICPIPDGDSCTP